MRGTTAFLICAVLGCNGSESAPAAPPARDAGVVYPRAPAIPCTTKPRENAPCGRPGAVCEYGESPDLVCNTLFVCASDPAYGPYWTEDRTGACPDRCPSAIVDGESCDVGDAGAGDEVEIHCATPTATCACTTGPGGANRHPRRWVCVAPGPSCPEKRPLLGQPCAGQQACDYGGCAFKRGTRMVCESGGWQLEGTSCP